ncbi:Lysine histidine transporter-like 8 [Euphorbia peplus]|nr:Lysine histidine transporter-like 8 [Euphorbia peplus]
MDESLEFSSTCTTPRPASPEATTPRPTSAAVTPKTASAATTPRPASPIASSRQLYPTPPISAPPSQFHSPSLSRTSLLSVGEGDHIGPASANRTPKSGTPKFSTPRIRTPRFITPIGSPIRRALRLTKLDPQDAWLPITESRNGNAYYAAFHCLCSGIGVQALILPVAFTTLGWGWGVTVLTLTFIWQLYTLFILVQLHESTEHGIRFSRYMQLANATFGEKLSKWIALVPILYLSVGTCLAMIIIGGTTSRLFFQTLPNLNSIAGVSLIGAITAVGYVTILWAVSVAEGRLPDVSYNPIPASSNFERLFDVLNALGTIAFAFRGHNLILEIQGTMPSSEKHPSRVPMWKGAKVAYALIAMCLFPLAIAGYWAYGEKIPEGGMLQALFAYHGGDTSRFILGLISIFVIINSLSSFQIYGMPVYDDLESMYTKRKKQPCPWWLRAIIRAIFGFMCFFVAVAAPSVGSVAGLIGGLTLPPTLSYPCFMWLKMKKPKQYSPMWCLNWGLGVFGIALSAAQIAAGVYVFMNTGISKLSFFNPQ